MYKFWYDYIFSMIFERLLHSYSKDVETRLGSSNYALEHSLKK